MPRNEPSAPRAFGDVTVLLAVALFGAVIWALMVNGPDGGRQTTSLETGASQDFFTGYVAADGRVIRHDQGDDTVSEGQAYALRLAVGDADAESFDRVWSWTRDHLQLSTGLFAWRWQDGTIADAEPVADADVDIAVALTHASDTFGRSDYADEARRIASAVLDHETTDVAGELVLVAGPWAVPGRVVNPSYLAPCDDEALATATDDPRWLRLRDSAAALLGGELSTGLPSDWSVVDGTGALQPIHRPEDPAGPAQYGLDAARVAARLWGCDSGQALSARLWDRVQHLAADGAYSAYALDGTPVDIRPHPMGLIAGALAAGAVGERDRATDLIGLAARLDDARPSYYGAAWLGLAEDLLSSISIAIPPDDGDVRAQEVADGSSSAAAPTSTSDTVLPAWWPAAPVDQTSVAGSLSVIVNPSPIAAALPVPLPPHPTTTRGPTTTTTPPPTVPPRTIPPSTEPPTSLPPVTEPPTTEPPTTEPPTTEPPTTEPPTTEPPTTEPSAAIDVA